MARTAGRLPDAAFWLVSLLIFFVATALRAKIFTFAIDEGDELIYKALVEQLHHGHGYTLRGHPLLAAPWIDQSMYDTPVFYHPPFGIYFFWGIAKLTGMRLWSLQLAQLFSFAIFYWSMLAFARSALPALRGFRPALLLPPLVAFTPIFAHVNMHVWIYNPFVAFFCLHAALLFHAAETEGKIPWPYWIILPLSSLPSTLTRVDSLPPYLFLYCLAAVRFRDKRSPRFLGALSAMFALNAAAAISWILCSNALHSGSGKPSAALSAGNDFIRATVSLSTTEFMVDYLKECATLVPIVWALGVTLAYGLYSQRERALRGIALAWVGGLWVLYGYLGTIGFSKLLRYIGMATPACLLLFAFALVDLPKLFADRKLHLAAGLLTAFLVVGYGTEIYQGVTAILWYGHLPWIRPLF